MFTFDWLKNDANTISETLSRVIVAIECRLHKLFQYTFYRLK